MKLTKTLVEGAPAKEKKYRLNDSLVPGLNLLVLPSGVKTYYFRHRTMDGIQRDLKLGSPVELTPEDARRLAREALGAVRSGKDPMRERQQHRAAPTIADLAARYQLKHGDRKRSGANDEIIWRLHILPALGKLKVATITREAIRDFHAAHPRPITANRCLEVLGKAMALAEEWGWRSPATNPVRGIKANPENKRKRYITAPELTRLRARIDEWESFGGPGSMRWKFARMVRILLLTGARLRNVMEARWDWVNWTRGELHVPAEQGKTGELIIHLGDRAIDLLLSLREHQSGGCEWVIEGSREGKPLVGYRKLWLALCREAEITGLRVHDLRHSFASYSLSQGQSLGVVGQLLGHQSTQTTQRYAHLIDDAAKRAVSQVSSALDV